MLTSSIKTLYLGLAVFVITLLGFIGLNFSDNEEQSRWSATGVMMNPALTPNSVLIMHEDIPGLMPAMTMPFALASADIASKIKYNDTVQFEFTRRDKTFVIDHITTIQSDASPTTSATSKDSDTSGYLSNSLRWNSEFTNHLGHQVKLADYKQKTLVVNFIYTRCPSICPTQISHLANVFNRLSVEERKRLLFVSITLDPDHDNPETLHQFADRFDIDKDGWLFLTGNMETTERTMNALNVMSYSLGNEEYNHSSNIYVVTNEGETVSVIDDSGEGLHAAILETVMLADSG